MRLAAVLGVLILTILGVWACQYSIDTDAKVNSAAIQTSLNIFCPKDSSFTFVAEEGFSHRFLSGTEIDIPKGILTRENGELVNGEVILNIHEYKDAIDLLVADIPMNLEHGMAKTAGAIKIEASQFGEKLFLDPTKNIKVKLACYEKEDDYSLYFFNEKENRLDSLNRIRPEMNEDHIRFERSIKKMKPWIKFPLKEDHFAFSYKGILDVIYNNNLTNVSHQMTKKKMQQYGLRWSNFHVESFIDFNGKQELAALMVWRNISKKPLPEWIKDGQASLEAIKNDRYRLIVEDSTGLKKFSTQIEPVISMQELFAFGPGYWKNDYEAKLKKVKLNGGHLEEMPSAFRSFKINQFGVYNCLRWSDEIPSVDLVSRYKIKNATLEEETLPGIFYLSGDGKGIMHYPVSSWNKIRFFDDPNSRIFSINENREILLFPLDQMSAIEYLQFKKMKQPSFIFKLERQDEIPENPEELRAILQIGS